MFFEMFGVKLDYALAAREPRFTVLCLPSLLLDPPLGVFGFLMSMKFYLLANLAALLMPRLSTAMTPLPEVSFGFALQSLGGLGRLTLCSPNCVKLR